MIRIPTFPGEFGLKLLYHAPAVFAFQGEYECEIEPGEESLYPGARRHIVGPRADDDQRAGGRHWQGQPVGPDSPKRYFLPEPFVPMAIPCDVVVCPRRRRYGSGKNWPHWERLLLRLRHAGLEVWAAGAPDSSEDLPCPRTWGVERFLDASIAAMRSARLVIATDAGLAHLAVLCGRPLLLITHGGLTAPGPQLDVRGQAMRPAYPPVRWDRYNAANHMGSPITEVAKGWTEPEAVAVRALELIAC